MPTVKMLYPAIGQTVAVRCESWSIPMIVMDVKQAYGVVRFLVSPQHGNGHGEQWVEIGRLQHWENTVWYGQKSNIDMAVTA
jgi:hypothetical protein